MRSIFWLTLLSCIVFNGAHADTQFLLISDIHYGTQNQSHDGQDTGTEFLAISLAKMKELSKQVDFILNLGDLPTHRIFNSPATGEYEARVFQGLYQADVDKKPIFYIPGNNDSLDGNYHRFAVNGKSPLNFAAGWSGACAFCKGLLIDDRHMRDQGYYSSYVMPHNKNIILIAMNTIPMISSALMGYPEQKKDAENELAWLEQQLKTHKAKQLVIAMHIPPGFAYNGMSFWRQAYVQQFIDILNKYHQAYGQITLLAGHTHMDELRKIRLTDGSNIYVYHAPSISRSHLNNPGLKIMKLNKNFAVKNYQTYYTESDHHWGNDSYQAMGSPQAIFPDCQQDNLSQCLDSLTDKAVCDDLEQRLFYGVKSDRVYPNACVATYVVSPVDANKKMTR